MAGPSDRTAGLDVDRFFEQDRVTDPLKGREITKAETKRRGALVRLFMGRRKT